jgi:hypothetical protein
MKSLRIWGSHVVDDLPAFSGGGLTPERSGQVAEHLKRCKRCREEYEMLQLGPVLSAHLQRVPAPEELWSSLEARWEERKARLEEPKVMAQTVPGSSWAAILAQKVSASPGPKLATAFGLLVLAVSATLLWHSSFRRAPDRSGRPAHTFGQFDLLDYIEPIKAAPSQHSVQAISKPASSFIRVSKEEALEAAGLSGSESDQEPLPGYRLAACRICDANEGPVVQLVYSQGEDAFCIFVAPRRLRFVTGKDYAFDTQVRGIRCQKVDCPKQETYLFNAGPFHCVLVSKSLDAEQAAGVMFYFISAQGQEKE